jgi:ribulose-phosphate 3-epimerase
MSEALIAPSILSADFARLGEQLAQVERGGAGVVHVDVMDGHFVPNLTLGPVVVKAVRRATRLPIDTHLMIENPERYIDAFVDAGANWVSVHMETVTHLQRVVTQIKGKGARAGVVLNPATPIGTLEEILSDIDYVLVMSVNPGFGGQSFLPGSVDKIRRLKKMIDERGLSVQIEVDGGVDARTGPQVVAAGARVLVAGSSVFDGGDPEAGVRRLLEAVR